MYEITKIGETDDPLLPSLDAAYILVMGGSSRLLEMDSTLFRLARCTFVQKNPGYRVCAKDGVDCSSRDIIHACQNICKDAVVFDKVLILEDDARLFAASALDAFATVDAFLSTGDYDAYSFGSLGRFKLHTCGRLHPEFRSFVGFAQAIVYTRESRSKLLQLTLSDARHIDAHFVSKLGRKSTFHAPLVVQLFATTDNMAEWGISKRPTRVEKKLVRLYVALLQKCLRLHKDVYAWKLIYAYNKYASWVLIAACPAVVTIVTIAALFG